MGHCSKALLLLTSYLALTLGQGLNVLIVYEEGNRGPENAVETAVRYLTQNNMANINKSSMVSLSGDPRRAAEDICTELDSMIDSGSPPDVVLDLSTAGESSEVVKSLSLTLGLPTVSSSMGEAGHIKEWSGLTSEQEKYLVQVRSPTDMLRYLFRDLATRTGINNVAILFDESFKSTPHYKHLLVNLPVRHTLVMMDENSGEITLQIERLYNRSMTNFLILASPENAKRALVAADSLKLFGEKYNWFVGTKSLEFSFDASCCTDMSVFTFQPKHPSGSGLSTMKGFGLYHEPLIDSAFHADLAAKTFSAVTKMKKDGSWPEMAYTRCSEFPGGQSTARSLDLMSALKMSGVADVWGQTHFSSNGESRMDFTLKVHLHKAKDQTTLSSDDVGTWTSRMPSSFNFKSPEMEDKLTIFKARDVYRVVTVLQPPFMMWNDTTGTYSGYAYEMMEEIKNLLGIEYELYLSPDGTYGGYDEETGHWSGLVGELHNRRADIGLGAVSVKTERQRVIDFTVPFYNPQGITLLMKKPKEITNLFKFFGVLEDSVWLLVVIAYFVSSFLFWVVDRFSPCSFQNNQEEMANDDETRYFNLKESFWFCLTTLTPQGGGEVPRARSGKLMAATWWVFAFITVASYTANLAAVLTVSRLIRDVKSLDDIMRKSSITYAPVNGSETSKHLQNMAYIESVYYETWKDMSLDDKITEFERTKLAVWDYPVTDKWTRIWQHILENGAPMTFEEALEKVRSEEEKFVLMADATDVRYQVLLDCGLRRVGEDMAPTPYALAVQHGSAIKPHLNEAILTLVNQRKLEGMKEKWWNQNELRQRCDDEDTGAIGIEDMGGIFIVIFGGLILTMITLGVEYWYYKFKANKPSEEDGDSEPKKVGEYDKTESKW